jgi:hypothetical protein
MDAATETRAGPAVVDVDALLGPEPYTPRSFARLLWFPAALLAAAAFYYLGGALYVQEIDDDPDYATEVEVPEAASRAVHVAALLVDREVNLHHWVANDPAFLPGYLLDNMPNFQTGLVGALGRFATELRDGLGRMRGSSGADPDLESAAGRLNYPGDVWIFEWSRTPVQPSSESQYRRAFDDLRRYNERLAQGQAMFDRRADNLQAALDRIAADVGGLSAALAREVELGAARWVDTTADDVFYQSKGRLYAYYLLLRELRRDFAAVVDERGLGGVWDEMLASLRAAAIVRPWIVANAALDSQTTPNHLAAQGFLLLRARTQLREITDILLKS